LTRQGEMQTVQDNADDYYQMPNALREELVQNEYVVTTEDERRALQALLVQKKVRCTK